MTALGFIFDNFEISIEASVCPALSKTPPDLATRGKTCPGDTISFFQISKSEFEKKYD